MEKMKKILSFTLSIMMTMSAAISVSPTVFADENEIPIETPIQSYSVEEILQGDITSLNIHDTINFTKSESVSNVTFYFVELNNNEENLDSAENIKLTENSYFDVPQKSSESKNAVSAKSKWTIGKVTNENGSVNIVLESDMPKVETITNIKKIPDLPENIKNIQLEIGEKFPSLANAESEFNKDDIVTDNDKTGMFSALKLYWVQMGDETEETKFINTEQDTVKEGKTYVIVMCLVADQTKATLNITDAFSSNNWTSFATYSNAIFTLYNKQFTGISNPYITELNCELIPDAENIEYTINGLPELTEEEKNKGVKYCWLYIDNATDIDAVVNQKFGKVKSNQFPFYESYLIDAENNDSISIAEDEQGNKYNKVLIIKCCPTTSIYGNGWYDTLSMKGFELGSESEKGNVVSSISGLGDFNFDELENDFRIGKKLPSLTKYNNEIVEKVSSIKINNEEQTDLIRRIGFVWYKEYADGKTEIVTPDDVVESGIKYKIALGVSFNAQKCEVGENIFISDSSDKWTHLKKPYLDTYFSYKKDFVGTAVKKLNGVTLTPDITKKSYTVTGLPELNDVNHKYVYYVRNLDDLGVNADADKFIKQSESLLIGYDVKGTALDIQYLTELNNDSTIIVPDRSVIGIFEIDNENLVHSATFEKAGVTYIDEIGNIDLSLPTILKNGEKFPELPKIDASKITVKKNGKEYSNFVKSAELKWTKVNEDDTLTDVDIETQKVKEGETYKIVLTVVTDSDKCVFSKNIKTPENLTLNKGKNASDNAEFTVNSLYAGVSEITSFDGISDSEIKKIKVNIGLPMPKLPEINVENVTVNGGIKGAVTNAQFMWMKVNNNGELENIIDKDYIAEPGVQYKIGLVISCNNNCSIDKNATILSPENAWSKADENSVNDYIYTKSFSAEKVKISTIDELSSAELEGVKLTVGQPLPELPEINAEEIKANNGTTGLIKSAVLKWFKQDKDGKLVEVDAKTEKVAEKTVYKVEVVLKNADNAEFTKDCKIINPQNAWSKIDENSVNDYIYTKSFSAEKVKISTIDEISSAELEGVKLTVGQPLPELPEINAEEIKANNGTTGLIKSAVLKWFKQDKDGKLVEVDAKTEKVAEETVYKIGLIIKSSENAEFTADYKVVKPENVWLKNYINSDLVFIYNKEFKIPKAEEPKSENPTNTTSKTNTSTTKITVNKVKSIKMTAVSNNAVKFKWSNVTGASGYQVWINIDGKWKLKKTVKGKNFRIGGLTKAKNYAVRVRAFKNSSGKIYYGGFSNTLKFTTRPVKPAKVSVSSKSKKSVTVSYKKSLRASGYQIQITSSKKLKGGKIINTSKSKISYNKLKSGKTYYIRVRSYKKLGSKKYCSGWTSAKKTSIK